MPGNSLNVSKTKVLVYGCQKGATEAYSIH